MARPRRRGRVSGGRAAWDWGARHVPGTDIRLIIIIIIDITYSPAIQHGQVPLTLSLLISNLIITLIKLHIMSFVFL